MSELKTSKKEESVKTLESNKQRKFSGVVVSAKSDKTIVVEVKAVKTHSKYKKRFTVNTKYKVHDEKNEHQEGDKVLFVECRPLSKNKRWRTVKA